MALRQGNDGRPSDLPPAPVPCVPAPRREDDAVARHRPGTPAYRSVLEVAYRLGRDDGRLAAAFDSALPHPTATVCRGRTPAEFAAYLWADQPGPVPGGLEVNAPSWYLAGFTESGAS